MFVFLYSRLFPTVDFSIIYYIRNVVSSENAKNAMGLGGGGDKILNEAGLQETRAYSKLMRENRCRQSKIGGILWWEIYVDRQELAACDEK